MPVLPKKALLKIVSECAKYLPLWKPYDVYLVRRAGPLLQFIAFDRGTDNSIKSYQGFDFLGRQFAVGSIGLLAGNNLVFPNGSPLFWKDKFVPSEMVKVFQGQVRPNCNQPITFDDAYNEYKSTMGPAGLIELLWIELYRNDADRACEVLKQIAPTCTVNSELLKLSRAVDNIKESQLMLKKRILKNIDKLRLPF